MPVANPVLREALLHLRTALPALLDPAALQVGCNAMRYAIR
jgi:hypothetical protein